MAFIVIGIDKLKSMTSVRGSQAHAYRTITTRNADPSRRGDNRLITGTRGDIVGDVQRRIKQLGYKPRKNAVPCVELLLTTSPQYWKDKGSDELNTWIDASMNWAKNTYGADNVVHAILHMDERTPHISMFVTPIINGRLTARDVVGNHQKMQDTHTSYAKAMERLGLQRGVLGSGAKRNDIDHFYNELNAVAEIAANDLKKLGDVEVPPESSLFQGVEGRRKAVEGWKATERGKRKELVQRVAQAALAATLAGAERDQVKDSNSGYKHANGELLKELAMVGDRLSEAYKELGLSKDQVGSLRKADISLVASHLGYMGKVEQKENPIDLVKRVNKFDYEQAVAWLYHEIGPLLTGAVISESLVSAPPERPFTPAENSIKRVVLSQCDALGCDEYRVSIVPEKEGSKPYLPGKSGDTERFYTKNELVKLIPWLRYENNQHKHIFITPMDNTAYYILLDDARVSAEELERKGFQPCLVQNTSWEKQQLVFKVPKSLDREAVLAVFNQMNKSLGDPDITGLRHPFRLAGFRNMKGKHRRDQQQPFVTVSVAVNRFCERCSALVRKVMRQVPKEAPVDPAIRP